MIKISDLSKKFNKGTPIEVSALEGLSLEVENEDFIVLVGANGSGKSTLLNLIAGTILPDRGGMIMNGKEISRWPEHRRSPLIARVFQNPLQGTASELSILDNFRLASLRTRTKGLNIGISEQFKQKVRDHIALLGMGLEDRILQPMGSLSGGQRQALTLSMAVMDEATLLLLDEPTAALDPKSSELILESVRKIHERLKICIIMVTHNLTEAIHCGNRLIQMRRGRIARDLLKREQPEWHVSELYAWMNETED